MSLPRLLLISCLCLLGGCKEWATIPQPAKPPPVTGSFIDFFPGALTPDAPKPVSMEALTDKPTIKVGLLLPLSGESEALGKSMMDAATLALYDTYLPVRADDVTATLTLLPKDTTASPTTAAQVAQDAINQGATLLIGPLYSQSVKTVAAVAHERNVPMIALSNNQQVAAPGVFIYGYTPEQQIERIVKYALSRQLTSYALLAPNDAFGNTVAAALQSSLAAKGGQMVMEERYGRSEGGRKAAATRLAAQFKEKPFRALLIADTLEASALMAETMQAFGLEMSQIQILGTGQWDEDAKPMPAILNGALFPTTSPDAFMQFENRFHAVYATTPERLSSLTYDAVAFAASLARDGKPITARSMTDQGLVPGFAAGSWRLLEDGSVERGYGIMSITPEGASITSPAPRIF